MRNRKTQGWRIARYLPSEDGVASDLPYHVVATATIPVWKWVLTGRGVRVCLETLQIVYVPTQLDSQ